MQTIVPLPARHSHPVDTFATSSARDRRPQYVPFCRCRRGGAEVPSSPNSGRLDSSALPPTCAWTWSPGNGVKHIKLCGAVIMGRQQAISLLLLLAAVLWVVSAKETADLPRQVGAVYVLVQPLALGTTQRQGGWLPSAQPNIHTACVSLTCAVYWATAQNRPQQHLRSVRAGSWHRQYAPRMQTALPTRQFAAVASARYVLSPCQSCRRLRQSHIDSLTAWPPPGRGGGHGRTCCLQAFAPASSYTLLYCAPLQSPAAPTLHPRPHTNADTVTPNSAPPLLLSAAAGCLRPGKSLHWKVRVPQRHERMC